MPSQTAARSRNTSGVYIGNPPTVGENEMINKYDTHFYVGTVHQHPDAWIIVGLFYPPRQTMGDLFDEAAN